METEKKGWGGARDGAGRRCMGAEKRVTIGARVAKETAEKLSEYSARLGLSQGKLLDLICQNLDRIFPEGSGHNG